MTDKRFYDWQTGGGTDDVMRFVACLERADIPWCAIGGVAVNHWAEEPMVTRDVDFVVAVEAVDKTVALLEAEGFKPTRFEGSVNFAGTSKVSIHPSEKDIKGLFAELATTVAKINRLRADIDAIVAEIEGEEGEA